VTPTDKPSQGTPRAHGPCDQCGQPWLAHGAYSRQCPNADSTYVEPEDAQQPTASEPPDRPTIRDLRDIPLFPAPSEQEMDGTLWPECKEFYELMQQYRHVAVSVPALVVDRYEAVKDWLRASRAAGEQSCPDCERAAKHAHSDATTPGFFHDKCQKHRTASAPSRKQRRCEICQSQGHVTLDHGDARGYSHSVVPAPSEQEASETCTHCSKPMPSAARFCLSCWNDLALNHTLAQTKISEQERALPHVQETRSLLAWALSYIAGLPDFGLRLMPLGDYDMFIRAKELLKP